VRKCARVIVVTGTGPLTCRHVTATWRIQKLSCRRLFLPIKATVPHCSGHTAVLLFPLFRTINSQPQGLLRPVTREPVHRPPSDTQQYPSIADNSSHRVYTGWTLVLSLPCLIYLRRSKSHQYLFLFQLSAVQVLLHTSCSVNPHARSSGTTTFRSITLSYSSPPYSLRNFTQCRNIVSSCFLRITTSASAHGTPRRSLGYRCRLRAAPLVTAD
jgi:hypothetical protein